MPTGGEIRQEERNQMVLDDDARNRHEADVDKIRARENCRKETVEIRDEPFDDRGVFILLFHFFVNAQAVDGCDGGFRAREEADERKQENKQDNVGEQDRGYHGCPP